MEKIAAVLFLILLVMGCSKKQSSDLPDYVKDLENLTVYSADTKPSCRIKLEEEQTFGDTKDVPIGKLKSPAVDDSGRVYLPDAKQLDIKVYNESDQYLTRLGKEGQGPGEFNEISSIEIIGNKLFAYDRNQQRAIVFSLDSLNYDYTVNFAVNRDSFDELDDAYLSNPYTRSDKSFLMEFTKSDMSKSIDDWEQIENRGLYYFLDDEGKITAEKVFEKKSSIQVLVPLPRRKAGMPVDFYGESFIALSEEDYIFSAWSTDFLIKVYSPDGEYERAFYYPIEEVPLTTNSASESGTPELLQKGMSSMDLPENWPVLNSLLVDDENRLWISTVVEDHEVYEWWILDKSGSVITKFEWSRDEPIEEIRNGYMYTRKTDKMGVETIVRYAIEME